MDEITLEESLKMRLAASGLKIAVAESSTGGLLCKRITDVPGASQYFAGGVVAYSNDIKSDLLGVSEETLDGRGAVSEETALEMAGGIVKVTGADIGVGITGIAGPGGATEDKPVGTICIALVGPFADLSQTLQLNGDRQSIRKQACDAVLEQILSNV